MTTRTVPVCRIRWPRWLCPIALLAPTLVALMITPIATAKPALHAGRSSVIHACIQPGTAVKTSGLAVPVHGSCPKGDITIAWNARGLPGPRGARGRTGPAATPGASGVTGAPGAAGLGGDAGAGGATGSTGATGHEGNLGAAGVTGATGPEGRTGATGGTGAIGATGERGVTGSTGATGNTGAAGSTGATGAEGTTGAAGPTGTTGPTGPAGLAGITYTAFKEVTVPKEGSVTAEASCPGGYDVINGEWETVDGVLLAASRETTESAWLFGFYNPSVTSFPAYYAAVCARVE